jgi:hypothetical protein
MNFLTIFWEKGFTKSKRLGYYVSIRRLIMANVVYGCGHSGLMINNGNKYGLRNWAKTILCPECQKKANEEAAREAAKKAEALSLPKLEGSEKQVVWAELIRAGKLRILGDVEARLRREKNIKAWKKFYPVGLKKYFSETSAKYWIENRRNEIYGKIYGDYLEFVK